MKPLKLAVPIVCALAAAIAAPIASSSPAALFCPGQTTVHPFAPWGDSASYVMVPNGSLETTAGWTLTGGAALSTGNETFKVNSASDSHSLSLPTGSSATSPGLCVTLLHPTLRFFATNTGSSKSTLKVEASTTVLGLRLTLPIGSLTSGATWQPTPVLLFLENLLAPVSGQVSFRFTPVGAGGNWRIDDVYVDPFKGR
jgi:hypothetical protein